MKNVINLLVIAMLLLMSCETEPTSPDEQLFEKELNEAAVFKALFFYLGDEVKAISSYEQQVMFLEKNKLENDGFIEDYEAYANAYLEKVKERNPVFLNQLKNAVQSRDFEQIRASMVYGGNLMRAITSIDALKTIKDEGVTSKFAKLNLEAYDFTNSKELELLVNDLKVIIKRADPTPHPDIAFIYAYQWNNIYIYNNILSWTYANVLVNDFLDLGLKEIGDYNPIGQYGANSNYENYSGERLIEEIAFAF